MAACADGREHPGAPMTETIETEPPPLSRTEVIRPGGRSLRRSDTVNSGDFLDSVPWKTVPSLLVERRTEKNEQDAAVTKTNDHESPLRCRTEKRPAVRSLQRSNTVTLGDYLDQMYMDPTSLLSIEKDQQDASVANTIGNEPPPFRTENKPVVRSLQRTNTVTLGDYLDPTYMDPALWKNMPLHLVELILSKVPFRDLVNLRRVCKYWNALILSEGFSPPFVPALIMFARTPTVRKMMSERNQPVPEATHSRRWSIFRLWSSARRMFKRKPCRCHARCTVHYYH